MKLALCLILLTASLLVYTSMSLGQELTGAAQTAEDLRAQLLDVQTREAALEARARQLDEDLKPENIERALAGIGSTKPEELREQRRRELKLEREGVRKQLEILATSRARLESAVRDADTRAYQQSALKSIDPLLNEIRTPSLNTHRWLIGGLAVLAILGIGALIMVIRRS